MSAGDFTLTKFDTHSQEMLTDAYKTITKLELWDTMKEDPGDGGFMFSNHEFIRTISANLEFGGHSGASFGWTMRIMQRLALEGWDTFLANYRV
jgi:hypothetical protein